MKHAYCLAVVFCSLLLFAPKPVHAEVHAWPFLEVSEDETTVFYPFFSRDESLLMVFPLYYRFKERSEHHVLWPLIKVQDGHLNRVFPFWFSSDQDSFTFFPFVFHDQGGTIVTIPPMKLAPSGSLEALYPFYGKSVHRGTDGTETLLNILWPLYSRTEVRTDDGTLVSRNRRWIIFSDSLAKDGTETIRLLGIPISERMRGVKRS